MDFHPGRARQLATLSQWTYGADTAKLPAGCSVLAQSRPSRTFGTPGLGVQFATSYAAVLKCPEGVVVAFRGTEPTNWLDWLQDADAALHTFICNRRGATATLGAVVHAGILRELNAVLPDIVACLDKSLAGQKLYLTGHSQGASEAILAAAALHEAGFKVEATYAFEPARVGDHSVAALIACPVFRCERGHDIVPHLPPDARLLEDPDRILKEVANAVLQLDPRMPGVLRVAVNALVDGAFNLFGKVGHFGVDLRAGLSDRIADLAKTSSEPMRSLLRTLALHLAHSRYESIGTLIYMSPGDAQKPITIPAAAEADLFYKRLLGLPAAGASLAGDHDMGPWTSIPE